MKKKMKLQEILLMKISKLLPYSIGKVKSYEEVEEREPMDIKITFVDTEGEEDVTTLQQVFSKKG